ncbi:pentatricopeptide repeat-containing protein At1g08070, chloroplastic-like [Aristolochia californica]|uniref:pentatricopeptide repeat-containing protein At1g08070, chloroplastic-like n=1 Tax=Aristolochia californica TaxID=171875 RepID=UPI0035DF8C37
MFLTPSVLPTKTMSPADTHSSISAISFSDVLRDPKTPLSQTCKNVRDLSQIHAHLIKTGLFLKRRVAENLLESSATLQQGSLDHALSIFRSMEETTPATYNIMIRAFTSRKRPQEAILLFKRMREDLVDPDKYTFPCVLKSCSRVQALKEGEQIHALLEKFGFGIHVFAGNSLIRLYAGCGKVDKARRLFERMSDRSIVTWNSLLSGYTETGEWEEVVKLFCEMRSTGVAFDEVTLISVLTACGRLAALDLGEWVNGYMEENGLKRSQILTTSLVDMFAKCGQIDTARQLFDAMTTRDVVAWSAMISGYSQSNRCREALALFKEMQMANIEPNEVTMVSVLASCAILGALETGKWVHFYTKMKRLKLTVNLGTALMDFYAKCGLVDNSLEVFEQMPQKNVLSWTVLILGLASNGRGREALEVFHKMQKFRMKPNDVTFIGVLSACSHMGLVDEGKRLFDTMTRDFCIEPRVEHYGCMVDILARAGLIIEAHQFINGMPIEPNAVVWRTVLAACKVHKNIEIGEESLRQLSRLDPGHSGDYILMSNIYASVGRWEDALKVRKQMKERGIKKTPGCSMIEVDGVIHEFFAEDSDHSLSKDIYDTIEEMLQRIKLEGFVPNTSEARLDAEEDEKEMSVSHHSEKLAIAFGLLKTEAGTTIRISKNLRVCTDCHSATKMISKVYKREIVVRDRNRFHHFKDGSCSCNDYW